MARRNRKKLEEADEQVESTPTPRRTSRRKKVVVEPVEETTPVEPVVEENPVDDIPSEDNVPEVAAEEVAETPVEAPVKKEEPKKVYKNTFRLIAGVHQIIVGTEPNGRAIRKRLTTGDVIESEEDLTKKFPNRFERLSQEQAVVQKVTAAQKIVLSPKAKSVLSDIKEDAKAIGKATPKLRVINRGGEKYDVIREDTGLPINDQFLTLEEAKALESISNKDA